MIKKPITNPVLSTWINLNEFLKTADEVACQKLLKEEEKGRRRTAFVLRIHSRYNRVRALRERELLSGSKHEDA